MPLRNPRVHLLEKATPKMTNDSQLPIARSVLLPPPDALQVAHLATSEERFWGTPFVPGGHDLDRVLVLLQEVYLVLICDAFIRNLCLDLLLKGVVCRAGAPVEVSQ